MARLPEPGDDAEVWGGILNEYLLVSHNADGTQPIDTVTGLRTALDEKISSTDVTGMVALTQTAYGALTVKSPNTLYVITAESSTPGSSDIAVERLVLGTTVTPGTPPVIPPTTHLLQDDFSRYANGVTPTVASTGQTWTQFSGPGYVTDGLYDAQEGSGAVYLEAQPGTDEINRIGAVWKFDTKGATRVGTGATLALVTWADGGIGANGTGRRTRCHVTITRSGLSYFVRDVENGGAVTNIGNRGISPALTPDVLHTAEVTLSGTTATISLSNGQVVTFTDPRIAPRSGEVFACLEPFYTTDGTDSRVRVSKFWANGTPTTLPPPPPANPTVVTSIFTGPNTPSTTRTLTIPAVQNGDLLVLSSSVLDQSVNHSQTAGPTFTSAGVKNSRAGISSQVWSRIASSADTGQTVTVTCSASLGGVIGLLVIRGVNSISTVATTNQASGNTSIAVPAFTPSPTTIPLHLVFIGSSTDMACALTPPSNITLAAANLPAASGRRSGIAYGINPTPNQAVGTTWTNTRTHFAATWLINLTV